VVLAASHFEGNKKGEPYSVKELGASYYRWLKFINSTTYSSMIHCITVINRDNSKIFKLQNILEEISRVQDIFSGRSTTINFYGGVKFFNCQYSDEVRQHLVGSLNTLLEDVAPKPLPSIKLVNEVTDYLKTHKEGVKAMQMFEFRACILEVIPENYRDNSEVCKLLIRAVEENLISLGRILIAEGPTNAMKGYEKNDSGWVVIDVNWLTRDVMGTIIKNMEGNKTSFKLSSKDINNLTGGSKAGKTAESYFNGDVSILPGLLHSIGACIPVSTLESHHETEEHWFPIFSRNPPDEASCQPLAPFSRLIVRSFRIKEADTHIFPPGYFPKLFVAIVTRFGGISESIDIFEGAMDLRFAVNNGNIQIIIRRVDEDSFHLIVAASNDASAQAWYYYLKLVPLFDRTSTMFTTEEATWENRIIKLEEFCYNLKFLPKNRHIFCKDFDDKIALKGEILSTIASGIKYDYDKRQQMLVYLYGIKILENGERAHVDEEDRVEVSYF